MTGSRRIGFKLAEQEVHQGRGHCRGCARAVVWYTHPRTGRQMALDFNSRQQEADGSWSFESHFAHCPKADAFRRAGKPQGEGASSRQP